MALLDPLTTVGDRRGIGEKTTLASSIVPNSKPNILVDLDAENCPSISCKLVTSEHGPSSTTNGEREENTEKALFNQCYNHLWIVCP